MFVIQSDDKPGSVPLTGCLSFIYTLCHHNAKAFYPPAWASNPQTPVYVNLQSPRRTARTSLHGRWALTPPSHPYPCGRLFSSALLYLRKQLSVRKWSALYCPDFPPLHIVTATDCPTVISVTYIICSFSTWHILSAILVHWSCYVPFCGHKGNFFFLQKTSFVGLWVGILLFLHILTLTACDILRLFHSI